jgi:Na+/H+-dicarboxylate symporter
MLQPGTASLFALVAIFNLQLIGYDMSFGDYIYILIASMIAVFATIGVPSPLDLFAISMVVLPFNIPPAQAVFFLLPWMYSGRRLDAANMIIGDFAVIQLFRDKVKKRFKNGNGEEKIT